MSRIGRTSLLEGEKADDTMCTGRTHLEQTILEADILTQIRRWLEPIGKAMPALNIQRALLDALTKVWLPVNPLPTPNIED